MTETLADFVAKRGPGQFEPRPQYFVDGDFIKFFRTEHVATAKRLGGIVTVYLSDDTGEMVGCKIKSVKALLALLGDFEIVVRDNRHDLELGLLVMAAAARTCAPEDQQEILKLADIVRGVSIDRNALPMAA